MHTHTHTHLSSLTQGTNPLHVLLLHSQQQHVTQPPPLPPAPIPCPPALRTPARPLHIASLAWASSTTGSKHGAHRLSQAPPAPCTEDGEHRALRCRAPQSGHGPRGHCASGDPWPAQQQLWRGPVGGERGGRRYALVQTPAGRPRLRHEPAQGCRLCEREEGGSVSGTGARKAGVQQVRTAKSACPRAGCPRPLHLGVKRHPTPGCCRHPLPQVSCACRQFCHPRRDCVCAERERESVCVCVCVGVSLRSHIPTVSRIARETKGMIAIAGIRRPCSAK